MRFAGRIGPYGVSVFRLSSREWRGVLTVTAGDRYRFWAKTLKEAKTVLVRQYVMRRLNLLLKRFRAKAEFLALYDKAWPNRRADPIAPQLLFDWLTDKGEEKEAQRFADEGREAGVKAEEWPLGWADAVARFG